MFKKFDSNWNETDIRRYLNIDNIDRFDRKVKGTFLDPPIESVKCAILQDSFDVGFYPEVFGIQNQPHFFSIRSVKLRILFQLTASYLVLLLEIFQIKNFAVKICQIKNFIAKICQIHKNKPNFLFPV